MATKTKQNFLKLYDQLNIEQRQAVDAIEGPVMILAGPGTGKTQVLAMRVANILRLTQMDPGNILCLTFTESAAAAMRQRLMPIIGEAAYYVHIQTFHSFCHEIIQDNPDKFSFGGQQQALSDIERAEMLRDLLNDLPGTSPLKPFGRPQAFLNDIIQTIQLLKKEDVDPDKLNYLIGQSQKLTRAAGQTIEDFSHLTPKERTDSICQQLINNLNKIRSHSSLDSSVWLPVENILRRYDDLLSSSAGTASQARTRFKNELNKFFDGLRRHQPRQKDLARIYRQYQSRLQQNSQYDFEDMILQVVERFRHDPELLAGYQEQFQYILVDEYQDTNGAQNEAVFLLGSFDTSPNIFVVGDDQQSIFRFQGASLDNMLNFLSTYKDHVRIISLDTNYRSQPAVITASSAVISHNQATLRKYLPAVNRQPHAAKNIRPTKLEWHEFTSADEEHFWVAEKIRQLLQSSINPSDVAVLYRLNREADDLLEVLVKLDIPVHLAAGENILQNYRVKQLIHLLTYLSGNQLAVRSHQDDESLAQILHFDFLGLNPLDVLKLIHFSGQKQLSLFTVISSSKHLRAAAVQLPEKFLELARQLAEWRIIAHNHTLSHLFDVVLNESGLLTTVLRTTNSLATLHQLSSLFNEVKRLNRADHNLTATSLVHRLKLMVDNNLPLPAEPLPALSHAVQLMTAHKAKGLEFNYVFLVHVKDRHWGNLRDRTRLPLPPGIVRFDPVVGQENNEDERRLFYVAITRARQQVFLSYTSAGERGRQISPSLFVGEIPNDLLMSSSVPETAKEAWTREKNLRVARPVANQERELKQWLKEIVPRQVLSVTHLNNYLICPKLFYHRHILLVPAAKTKHQAFGTAVHAALRDLFTGMNKTRRVPALVFLQKRFQLHLEHETLTQQEMRDSLALGQKIMAQYFRHYHRQWRPPVMLEYNFRSHHVRLDDIPLTGRLDKIDLLPNNQINVVDYKTGNPDRAYQDSRPGGQYHRQLVFYKLLCDRAPRFKYTMVSGDLDFIQMSAKRKKFIKLHYEISAAEVLDLEQTIKKVWQDIQDLKFLDDTKNCGKCEYCSPR